MFDNFYKVKIDIQYICGVGKKTNYFSSFS